MPEGQTTFDAPPACGLVVGRCRGAVVDRCDLPFYPAYRAQPVGHRHGPAEDGPRSVSGGLTSPGTETRVEEIGTAYRLPARCLGRPLTNSGFSLFLPVRQAGVLQIGPGAVGHLRAFLICDNVLYRIYIRLFHGY